MFSRSILLDYKSGCKSSSSCPLCDSHVYQGEICRSCFAPSEVIDSILARGREPRFVGVLGPSGVGKTVYLGMLLDLLARGAGDLRGMARGPFSLALHRGLILSLERQRFPDKTPAEPDRWQWVHCEVSSGKRGPAFDIVTPDVAGEAVMEEMENPGSNKTLRALISRCAGVVILMDLVQVVADGQGQELFAMQLISYLDAIRPSKKKSRKTNVPVAVVFTKADLLDDGIADPVAFARGNAPGLHGQCEARLERFSFYASGVAGSTAKVMDNSGGESLVPLRVEPRGIVEPFAWMVDQLDA